MEPLQKPDLGFYYHYKHDPSKGITEHAYRVLGVSMHSEDRSFTVVYQPLGPAPFLKGADYMNRPLAMFMEEVIVEGKPVPRFSKITDPYLIRQMEAISADLNHKE